jgi:tetratricopeptide (TPR) repeat protein
LNQIVQGELDWIVMKSLDKDRNRRYESASAFAADIERYLADEPVQACPPSATYRLQKYAKRNQVFLTTAVLVFVSLIVGAGVASWQAVEANSARDLADDRLMLANDRLESEKKAKEDADEQRKLADANFNESETQRDRAESNLQLAMDALNAVYLQSVGNERVFGEDESIKSRKKLSDKEKKLLQTGLDFYAQIASQNESNTAATFGTARAFLQIGQVRARLGDDQEAKTAISEAITRFNKLTDSFPDNAQYFKHLSNAYFAKANLRWSSPQYQDTLAHAETALSRAIELDPKDASTYAQRGWVRRHQRNHLKAFADYEKAVELGPDDARLQSRLSERYRFVEDVRLRDLNRSLELAKKVVELAPQNATYQSILGRMYWDVLRDRKRALNELDKAIELDPNLAHVYIQRKIVIGSSDFPRALEEINKALKLAPESAYALRHRGGINHELGRLEEALADYNKSQRLNPNTHYMYLGRAAVYLEMLQYQAAISDYSKAIELAPHFVFTYKRRAVAHFHLKHYEKALADIARGLELGDGSSLYRIPPELIAQCPDEAFRDGMLKLADKAIKNRDTAGARLSRARLLDAFGNDKRAIIDYDKAIENKDTASARLGRAGLLSALGNDKQALIDYDKAIELEPKDYSLRTWWTKFFADRNRWQDVAIDSAREIELKPDYFYSHYQLALASLGADDQLSYRNACRAMLKQFANSKVSNELHFAAWTCSLAPSALDDYTAAIALAEQVIELEPDSKQYLNGYGAILFRAGRYDAAITQLQAALKVGETSRTSPAYIWYFLAMTHHQLDNTEQARNWFTKAADHIRNALTQGKTLIGEPLSWNRRLTLQLFHNEATQLLGMPVEAKKPNQNQEET